MSLLEKIKINVGDLKPTKETDYSVGNEYLIEDIKVNGYDNEKSKILVDKNLNIIDGHHRAEQIKKNYGKEKEIIVNKVKISNKLFWIFFYVIFLFSPIFVFLSFVFNGILNFPINIVKKYINGFKKSRSRNKGDIE